MKTHARVFFLLITFPFSVSADIDELDSVVVYGHQTSLNGEAVSASEGIIGQGEISQRPVLRSGEILEFVPGMVVTQHSGSGKANQYFLRGFNLDHGTDFRTEIDGMPINMRTHGHGQGYTDLNFIIPEFIDSIDYQKGPYHAENGDFSTAGNANFSLLDSLQDFAQIELGEDAYRRGVFGKSLQVGEGSLMFGLEAHQYRGPWEDIDENVQKWNGLIRYQRALWGGEFSLNFLAYDNQWNAADQIPQRAVDSGLIDRLGSLDTDVGGESSRYSLSANWRNDTWQAHVYAIRSRLNLFSNFTYFLDDPINGDEFEQVDSRWILGGGVKKTFSSTIADLHVTHRTGLDVQLDDIDEVALHHTQARERLDTTRQDDVKEASFGLFWESDVQLTDKLRANLGLRYDYFYADVSSDEARNSGTANDDLISVKSGLTYWLTDTIDLYLNAGQSFHSNDARGATIEIDPATGEDAAPVDLLVRGEGAELGIRYYLPETLNLSAALWWLSLDSELVFVGDAGNTEASGASRRWGFEIAAYYWLGKTFSADVELAWTRARFTESAEGEGDHVEGSLPFVASLGFTWQPDPHWQTQLRVRHFGSRVLNSDDSFDADPFTVVNAGVSYHAHDWRIGLDLLNLFDSDSHDIEYLYESRLAGESSAREDLHFHPIEPRTLRVSFAYDF